MVKKKKPSKIDKECSPLRDKLCSTPDGRRQYEREWVFLQFSEHLAVIMQKERLTLQGIAKKTGMEVPWLQRILEGRISASMVVHLVDMFTALGYSLDFTIKKRGYLAPRMAKNR